MQASTGAHLVASLVVDFGEEVSLVNLARIGGAGAPQDEAAYALAFPFAAGRNSGGDEANLTWSPVGPLTLGTNDIERVLLAGLSVVAMNHVREAGIQIGDAAIVLGADPWSLLLLQWAKLQGASPVVFAGHGSPVLGDYASSTGVDAMLMDPSPREITKAVKSTHRGSGFAVAFDAVATDQSITHALSALHDGGRYVLAGLDPKRHVSLNAYPDLHRRDLEIISPMRSQLLELDVARLFRFSLDLANQGRLRLTGLLDPALGWHAKVTRQR
jgi:threonine dehydrogenase-like Zn-dependent dehydrogenase